MTREESNVILNIFGAGAPNTFTLRHRHEARRLLRRYANDPRAKWVSWLANTGVWDTVWVTETFLPWAIATGANPADFQDDKAAIDAIYAWADAQPTPAVPGTLIKTFENGDTLWDVPAGLTAFVVHTRLESSNAAGSRLVLIRDRNGRERLGFRVEGGRERLGFRVESAVHSLGRGRPPKEEVQAALHALAPPALWGWAWVDYMTDTEFLVHCPHGPRIRGVELPSWRASVEKWWRQHGALTQDGMSLALQADGPWIRATVTADLRVVIDNMVAKAFRDAKQREDIPGALGEDLKRRASAMVFRGRPAQVVVLTATWYARGAPPRLELPAEWHLDYTFGWERAGLRPVVARACARFMPELRRRRRIYERLVDR